MIKNVLPTSFTVRDMEKALEFYCDVLGFTVSGRDPSGPRGGPTATHPLWGQLGDGFRAGVDHSLWDPYQEKVCGIEGARLNEILWLVAPDGQTLLELLEYAPAQGGPLPRRRAFDEPGKAIVVMAIPGLEEFARELRAKGADLVSDPQFYGPEGHVPSLCLYLYDRDDNAMCLVENLDQGVAPRRVLPTSFTVRNMQKALDFYCDLLGFRIIGRDPSLPRGGGQWSHPLWGVMPEHNPDEKHRAEWDAYQEKVCGTPGARINVFHWLLAPDGKTVLELLEYAPPKEGPVPRRRAFNEPGKAIGVMAVDGLVEFCKGLRRAGVALVSDPQFYGPEGEIPSYCAYLHDTDDNAICLVETLPASA